MLAHPVGCPNPYNVGDGLCNYGNMLERCDYDGGDCEGEIIRKNQFCFDSEQILNDATSLANSFTLFFALFIHRFIFKILF